MNEIFSNIGTFFSAPVSPQLGVLLTLLPGPFFIVLYMRFFYK